MNFLKRFISEWFGYSRRERRASVILIVIIAVVFLVRFIIPEKDIEIEVNTLMVPVHTEEYVSSKPVIFEQAILSNFDPNTASLADLTSLGITGRVAATLIRYRSSGGIFRKPEDIMKIYGIDSALAKTLIPYINIVQAEAVGGEKKPVKIVSAMKASPVFPLIDLNRCDSAELEVLPGIGPVLSKRIIKYRELLGGFFSSGQLKEVYGLADSVYNVISEMIIVDSSVVRKIDINKAVFRELERHPYLERYEVQSIIKYREVKGNIRNLSELTTNRILSEAKAKRISGYFSF